jgi:thiol-disulfide isomerase/thioredoxin
LVVKRILLALLIVLCITALYEGFRAIAPDAGGSKDFSATTVKGEAWSLSDHRSKGPVLLSFFATWCSPCAQEFPHLLELKKKYPELEIVLLTEEATDLVDKDPALTKAPITLIANASTVFGLYGVSSIPHTVFYGRDGSTETIAGYFPGSLAPIEKRLASGK